jgi:hypothetical protein
VSVFYPLYGYGRVPSPASRDSGFQKRGTFILHEKENPFSVEQRQRQRMGFARSAATR